MKIAITGLLTLFCVASAAHAQNVEVTPFGGYRFGGGFFEEVSRHPVDLDGAATLGVALDIRLREDLFFEGFVTHQRARFTIQPALGQPRTDWRISVDHFQAGGLRELQEVSSPRVRPFLTGTLGLTRYASEGDDEVRFAVSAGGGVKLLPAPNIGVRLDGRLFATIADVGDHRIACTPGFCLVTTNAQIMWQAEFTAGVVVRF